MCSEWTATRLRAHVDLQTGYPFKSADFSSDPTDPRLLRGDNIIQGRIRWDGVKRWPRGRLGGLEAYRLRDGDVVVAMDRPWIEAGLKRATVAADGEPIYLVQRVARLRGRASLDQRFLRYIIASAEFTNHVLAVQTGTSVPHISGPQILEFQFHLPPLDEQRMIAAVLGALDDKIEANRALNETLEETCQALFRSWFVDFDPVVAKSNGRRPPHLTDDIAALFPDRLEDSPIGPVPAGWNVGGVGDIAELSRESVRPQDSPLETFLHFSIPAFDSGKVPAEELGRQIQSNKFLVPGGAVLLAKLNPHIPRVWWPDDERERRAVASTEFLVLTPRAPMERDYLYGLFSSSVFLVEFSSLRTGTSNSHQRVKPDDFLRMPIVVPVEAVARAATRLFRPIMETQVANVKEAQTLAAMRDALLPRLLSGELRVRQAEKLVQEVV